MKTSFLGLEINLSPRIYWFIMIVNYMAKFADLVTSYVIDLVMCRWFLVTEILYSVSVHTGTLPASGTDADIFITIFGEQGDSCKRRLNHSHFERGQVSTELCSLPVYCVSFIAFFQNHISFQL